MKTTLRYMDDQVNVISLLLEKRMACCTFVTKLASICVNQLVVPAVLVPAVLRWLKAVSSTFHDLDFDGS